MSHLCTEISNAKCCVVDFAAAYVTAANKGAATPAMFNELQLMNAYVAALERFDCNPERCLTQAEACQILEQIALSCESCECGC